MRRRNLLKGIGVTVLQFVFRPALALPFGLKRSVIHRVRPSDPLWPSAASWAKLKAQVGGNLIQPRALFADCQTDANGEACAEVRKSIRNPFYIGDQPAGTEVSGWLDAWTPAPSAYAVRARNAADVAAAVNFARENNLRLVVKGGGHSYLGTSNAPDSLLVWTRAMNKVTVHDAFVGQGCKARTSAVPAVTVEAGAMWIDVYHAVTTEAGRYVQGGGCTTVGVAGLIQSGGFGSFSKGFGTAASGLLEAEVVTADGRVRIANACTNPDLFWALKGGGGGSFGVVTKVTLLTHELPEYFGYAGGRIKAQSDAAFQQLIARFISFYRESLFNSHWGESVSIGPDNTLRLNMVCQGLDNQQVANVWKPFFDSVKNSKDLTAADLEAGAGRARHWWDIADRKRRGNDSMISDSRPGAPATHAYWSGDQGQVGAFLHGYDSLWLPASLLENSQQSRLADALFAASRQKKVELHFNKGIAGAPPAAAAATRDTATNPAVVDAFVLVIIADGGLPAYPGLARPSTSPAPNPAASSGVNSAANSVVNPPMNLDFARGNAHKIDLAAAELRKIAPNAGSYVSESNYFNASWQKEYWGTNYPKLRAIKKKYDPEGLFFVHHGVGSEDWTADGFTRVAKGS
ncbi:MAG TPA: FAD-binding protein [Blastocatellia bacterium]|nr:FAD-binding protein [Blastocatellia bacterium]